MSCMVSPVPAILTRRTCAWSISSHNNAENDVKGMKKEEWKWSKGKITSKVPVKGRNTTCSKVSSVFHPNPALPALHNWLFPRFRFTTPEWICSQTSGWCRSSLMLEAGADKWPVLSYTHLREMRLRKNERRQKKGGMDWTSWEERRMGKKQEREMRG